MHPVICRKLGSERSQHLCSCSVISTVIPTYCLHVCSKISVSVSCNIYTEEFSVASACIFYSRCYICRCFLSLILDSGICSCFSCLKCKAVAVFHCIFQTVGICCYCCCCCIGAQLYLTISTFQYTIIGNYVVFLAKCCIIFCSYSNRNVFQAIYFIMIHIYGCSVCFCNGSFFKSYSFSVCQLDSILIHPCCDRISASVLCHDSCLCLEASSVKSMVCSCSCYRIKSTFVKFLMAVQFLRRSCISCCIHTFRCPVLCPGQACIHILILSLKFIRIRKCLCLIFCCCKFVCTGSFFLRILCCAFLCDLISALVLCRNFFCISSLSRSCLVIGNLSNLFLIALLGFVCYNAAVQVCRHYSCRKTCCCHCKT